jgi:hypothetical protein
MTQKKRKPMTCPHCGGEVRRPNKPRDLGLFLHALCYRVPVHVQEITPEIIEAVRKHCKMTPKRLEELKGPDYIRFWEYMEDRRERRRKWMEETGEVPAYGWTPKKPGEQDRGNAVLSMHLHRMCAAKIKKHLKEKPEKYEDIITNTFNEAKKFKGVRRMQAMNRVLNMLNQKHKIERGEPLKQEDLLNIYETLGPGRKRKRRK